MALILPRIEEKSQVAVIGAGLAGLSCASVLVKAGMQVTVFEKSRSVAGRMSTRKGDRSPEIGLILRIVKEMYKKEGITFGA